MTKVYDMRTPRAIARDNELATPMQRYDREADRRAFWAGLARLGFVLLLALAFFVAPFIPWGAP